MSQNPGREMETMLGTLKQRGFCKGIGYTYIRQLKEKQRWGSQEIRKQKVASISLGLKAPKRGGYITRIQQVKGGGHHSRDGGAIGAGCLEEVLLLRVWRQKEKKEESKKWENFCYYPLPACSILDRHLLGPLQCLAIMSNNTMNILMYCMILHTIKCLLLVESRR